MSWQITLLYLFSWNCTWFGQKVPIKVQNFRLSTAHVKYHQIYTLLSSFFWKYIKFQVKKYRGVMSHDTDEWCKIWRKLICCFKTEKNLVNFDRVLESLLCKQLLLFLLYKVYNVWAKKVEMSYRSWHWGVMQNLKKTDLWFGKWHEEFGKFSPEHLKVSKLGLWWDPFVQSRKCMSLKFTEELYIMTMKNDAKL